MTVILERYKLSIVVESRYGRFYLIGNEHEVAGDGDLNLWVSLLKPEAIKLDLDLKSYVISAPIWTGPLVWDCKISSKAKKHFSFNPKTGKANNYKPKENN